jgi:hypothetical protein
MMKGALINSIAEIAGARYEPFCRLIHSMCGNAQQNEIARFLAIDVMLSLITVAVDIGVIGSKSIHNVSSQLLLQEFILHLIGWQRLIHETNMSLPREIVGHARDLIQNYLAEDVIDCICTSQPFSQVDVLLGQVFDLPATWLEAREWTNLLRFDKDHVVVDVLDS